MIDNVFLTSQQVGPVFQVGFLSVGGVLVESFGVGSVY